MRSWRDPPWFALIEMTPIHLKHATKDGLDGIGFFVPGFALAEDHDQVRIRLERSARQAFERHRLRHPDIKGQPIITTDGVRKCNWLVFIVLRGSRLFPVGMDFTWYPAENDRPEP
ncbi:hypothetical protein [Maricaulis sp.]|uniref:hypothetical protein n=1 Tax=unclassified Maricaulis TaxID=2632371 RepID=UPI001B01AF42|nr:hypothetical protein [Maricaulis sp.]MBO6797787.1 hypothetical protein [Maricaulis sp.]